MHKTKPPSEITHKATLIRREKLVAVREVAVTLREAEICAADAAMLASSAEQIAMLQQANAHLVIASMDANKLTEQVKTAKVKLDHLAHHDGLTDLPNRMLLKDRLVR